MPPKKQIENMSVDAAPCIDIDNSSIQKEELIILFSGSENSRINQQ
jgi:hypothetical protein